MPEAGYSGTPLHRKLGLREGARIGLVNAPKGFEPLLHGHPACALIRSPRSPVDLLVWFVTERETLERDLHRRAALAPGFWIAWPKKSSGIATTITEDVIREVVLPRGLVDIKVCAIDATWSGLRIARRRP